MLRIKQLLSGMGLYTFWGGSALADYTLNMTPGVTKVSREVYGLHMLSLWIVVAIGIAVFGVMFYSMFHHRKSRGAVAAQFHESALVEMIWTIVPFIILIGMAFPATKTMIKMYDTEESDMTIKVTGYQWKWRYEYLDEGIDFMSNLDAKSNAARQLDSGIDPKSVKNYLLNVDNPLVIPIHTKIRFLLTAADVLHAWWVPDFGWKKDAIPGFVNEAWAEVEVPGTYRGQCAELCGKDHGFMPIVVIAKTKEEYRAWVEEQKGLAEAKTVDLNKTFELDELITLGETVYNANCSSCHQINGEGVPGTFPAMKGSPVATGEMETHINVVLKGKGEMMPAFGDILDPVDLAAVITYERNAFGNDKGDSVQPSEINTLIEQSGDE